MRVTLTHRLGQHAAGSSLTYTDTQGRWLIERGHATYEPVRTAGGPLQDSAESVPDDSADAPTDSLAALRTRAESLGLPTYGTKAALTVRIATHVDHG
jgi:hypothetical protein